MNRTSRYANIEAIKKDYTSEADINEVIDAVEAAKDDPFGSEMVLFYGTDEIYIDAGYTKENGAPWLK